MEPYNSLTLPYGADCCVKWEIATNGVNLTLENQIQLRTSGVNLQGFTFTSPGTLSAGTYTLKVKLTALGTDNNGSEYFAEWT